jgi:transcriptional regulator NrdR family protein
MNDTSDKPTDHPDHVGLRCRRCGHQRFRVVYTRPAPGGMVVRRRACRKCGRRITTREREVCADVVVDPIAPAS